MKKIIYILIFLLLACEAKPSKDCCGSIPSSPTDVSVASKSENSVTLSWTASTGFGKDENGDALKITSYNVQVSKASNFSNPRYVESTGTAVDITELEGGMTYYFRVRAENSVGKIGNYSSSVTFVVGTGL